MQFYDLHKIYNLNMKRSNNNQSHQINKTGKTMITSNHEYKITTNILCDI